MNDQKLHNKTPILLKSYYQSLLGFIHLRKISFSTIV